VDTSASSSSREIKARRGGGRAAKTQQPLSHWRESMAPVHIDVRRAQVTRVVVQRSLLSAADIALVLAVRDRVHASTDDPLLGNRQNAQHALASKCCTFLHQRPAAPPTHQEAPHGGSEAENAEEERLALRWRRWKSLPTDPFRSVAPLVLKKLLRFAQHAWAAEGWSEPGAALADIGGPRCSSSSSVEDGCTAHDGGVGRLRVRVVEHWRYNVSGHLDDALHFDGGSVLTIIAQLNGGFAGGELSTLEANGSSTLHRLIRGDVACFVSHKYHSITPIITNHRESLVIELWQGRTTSGRFDQGG
jgi:hypothetical protein